MGASWDDEDAEEEPDPELAKAAPKPAAPMKASKVKELAMKKKEEEEIRKAKEKALRRQKEFDQMTPDERKARMEKMQRDSDLEAAKDLFMGGSEKGVSSKFQNGVIDSFKASTDEDYRKLAELMGKKGRELHTDKRRPTRYVQFVKDLMKELVDDLGPDEVGEVSQQMTYLTNQKRDEYKKAKGIGKKKGKKKPAVKVERGNDDFSQLDDDLYEDFM